MKRKTGLDRKWKKKRELEVADMMFNSLGMEKMEKLLEVMKEYNMEYLDFAELKAAIPEYLKRKQEKEAEDKAEE